MDPTWQNPLNYRCLWHSSWDIDCLVQGPNSFFLSLSLSLSLALSLFVVLFFSLSLYIYISLSLSLSLSHFFAFGLFSTLCHPHMITSLSGKEKHKQQTNSRDCPGTGWVAKLCLCVFFGLFLMGEKTHKQNPPKSGDDPAKMLFMCSFVRSLFSLPSLGPKVRVAGQKSELQTENKSYSRADPRIWTGSHRKGIRTRFRCIYRNPPLKPSWIHLSNAREISNSKCLLISFSCRKGNYRFSTWPNSTWSLSFSSCINITLHKLRGPRMGGWISRGWVSHVGIPQFSPNTDFEGFWDLWT